MVIALDAFSDFSHIPTGGNRPNCAYYEHQYGDLFDKYCAVRGTGGSSVLDIASTPSGAAIFVAPSPKNYLSTQLAVIEQAFSLTKNELAQALKTTRKTIYNWLDGASNPQERNLRRLFDLYLTAKDWIDTGVVTDATILRRPVVESQSLFDLLCADEVDRERVLFAASRLALSESRPPIADPFV